MKWFAIGVLAALASLVSVAALAGVGEKVWGDPGSDCPWGSSTCADTLGSGGSSSNPSAGPVIDNGCTLPATLPCELGG